MSIFDIKPDKKRIEAFCFNQGVEAFVHGDYTKRGVAVNAFFGIEGLNAFVFGYKNGLDIINPFSPYQWMFNDFYIYRLNGGDK